MGIPIRYIYLDLPAEKCIERIKTRARPEEKTVDLDYLMQLQTKYQSMKD